MKRMMANLVGAGAIAAFAAAGVHVVPAAQAADPGPAAAPEFPAARAVGSDTVTLEIEGMTCGGCAIASRIVLERLDGVEDAEVGYEERQAVVVYDPEQVSVEEMAAAIGELGYTATVVEPEDG